MAAARKFKSIQLIVDGQSVALVAVADDGTAWTARTHSTSGFMNGQDLEWKQITALPENESIKPMGVFL